MCFTRTRFLRARPRIDSSREDAIDFRRDRAAGRRPGAAARLPSPLQSVGFAVGASGMVLVLLGMLWPFLSGLGTATGSEHDHSGCGDCCPSIHRDEVTGAWSLRVPFTSAITLLGGIGLVTAHLGNLRHCAHGHR
ncbi:MAG: hypothetical protein JNK49_07160 [Planctomycetes bacterium]|nr:hypothetical protein [Planctomycetota bacterium]